MIRITLASLLAALTVSSVAAETVTTWQTQPRRYVRTEKVDTFAPGPSLGVSPFGAQPSMCVQPDGTLCQRSYEVPAGTILPEWVKAR